MRYLGIIGLLYALAACNFIPANDPEVGSALITFQDAVRLKDAPAAWDSLSREVQARLNEPVFRKIVAAGAEYEDLIELFRNAHITTRTSGGDIETEYPFQMTNPSGSQVGVEFVMVQEATGEWKVGNLLLLE